MAVPPPPTFEEYGRDVFAAPPRKPTLEQRGAAADVGKKEVDTEKVERTLPTTVQTNQAPEGYMWVDPNDPSKGVTAIPGFKKTDRSGSAAERKARIRTSLAALQRVRELAEERLAVGSASEFMQNVPLINQNRRNIEAAIENAQSGIISDVLERLAEINQGGVTGLANTAPEARRMGAQIANLDPNQDFQSLMAQGKLAEEYYLRQAAALEGRDAVDKDLMTMYLPEARLLELAATDPGAKQLSADGTETIGIPDWYQQSHLRYLIDNKDDLDPSQYAAFRASLDEKAGLTPNISAYVGFANDAREFFKQGGAPQQLGIVPPVTQDVSALRQGITDFAQTPAGAGVISATTGLTAGIPVALAGGQEKMEAVRQNQPLASFIGDVVGQTAATALLGPASRIGGVTSPFLRSPVTQDAIFSTISGATQAEDPLEGAMSGLVSSLGGEYAGRAVGRALPDVFAPGAMREARESVPSSGDLGQEADALYRRAAAQGQMVDTPEVETFIDDTEQFLRANGFIDQNGSILGTGPVQDAYRLLASFRGRTINPAEAQTLRKKIAEGRLAMRDGAPDNTARMFSGEFTDRFDDFAETAMPGIAEAREVAQRRIIGRELERARELGRASRSGEDLGTRRAFGNLDTAEIRGRRMYPDDVSEAIQVVSRGTPARNVAQGFGRLSPQAGTGRSGGLLAGIGLGSLAGDAAMGGALTSTMYGAGLVGRRLASTGTRRDAELAELIARGGPAFQNMLNTAAEEAAIRGGRIGSSIGATAGITPLRDVDLIGGVPDASMEELEANYPAAVSASPAEQPALEDLTSRYAGDMVDAKGNEVAPPEALGPKAGDLIVVDNRDAVYDPVAKAYVFADTGEIARKVMKRGGAVKGYQNGGRVGEPAFQRRQREQQERQAAAARQQAADLARARDQRAEGARRRVAAAPESARRAAMRRAQPRPQTSALTNMAMAASRRSNDLVAALADLADYYGVSPANAVAWAAENLEGRSPEQVAMIRRNLQPLGSNREIINAAALTNERRFREAGGLGARSEDEAYTPVELGAITYRPQDVPRALVSEAPRAASAVGDYLSRNSVGAIASDAARLARDEFENMRNDPYGYGVEGAVYSAFPMLAGVGDYAAARESSRMLDPYTKDDAETRDAKRMVDALSALPLVGGLGVRRVKRKRGGPAKRKR